MNYDKQLLSMSQEVQHWERLRMAVPYIAMEIQAQREKYRVLRDKMLMLVHDYNKVGGASALRCSQTNSRPVK
jgi:dynein heavy chain